MKKPNDNSLSDQAYARIKNDIVTCLFAPGQWIAQAELVERYQVGLTPVREALRRLTNEGFVRALARMGYQISPITSQDIEEMYELRLILESSAARLAALRASAADLQRISDAAQITYQYKDRQSYTRFLISNADFHVSIGAASRNQRLAVEISKTMDELTRVFHLGLDLRDSADEMRRDHQTLAAALSAHDVVLAERLARAEIQASRERVIEALQRYPNEIDRKEDAMADNPVELFTQPPAGSDTAAPDAEEGCFRQHFPAYETTRALDRLRQDEYGRLDRLGQIYLDYTGGGLYSAQQVKAHQELLLSHVYGNPHSTNPTSQAMTRLVESARAYVLEFFNASPQEYVCIFTQNASGALKLVGELYLFGPGSRYLLTFDNHNSVNGIREFARARGATITYAPTPPPEMRIDAEKLESYLDQAQPGANHLFAYPAQSNFSGAQHSLEWIERAQQKGWDVLLDAAAFVPSNPLDLSAVHPDFVCLSFYKLFGYPTGVGALLARRSALVKLRRPWFAGGTITVASVQGDRYFLHLGAEGFEDGTLNYLTLPAVEIGLRHITRVGYDAIHTRVACLTGWLLEQLSGLRHTNGLPVVKIYGPLDTHQRGGTITLNFFDPRGHFVDHLRVEERANQRNISLRTGCFCNPGGGELALGLSAGELNTCFALKPRMEYQDFRRCIDDKSTGAVRISVGLVSNFADAHALVQFARQFVDLNSDQV